MTEPNYALTYIEIDVDRCSLTYGTLPCRARLGYVDDPTDFVAATFAATNNLERAAGLTGAVDAKTFTINCGVRRASAAAAGVIFAGVTALNGATARLLVELEATTNKLHIQAKNAAGTTILDVQSSALSLNAMHHIVASFNLANAAQRHLYVDGVADLATVTTYTDDTIDLTLADWSVGAYADLSAPLTGDMGDLWYEDAYIDLSVAANLAEFIRPTTKNPVDLGADGSTPTGSSPLVYLGRDIDTWETNKGTGGGFTRVGAALTETVVAGEHKCFNSLGTCQDRTNFTNAAVTLRFAMDADYRPHDIEVEAANIDSVSYSPAVISLGGDLGQRSSLTVTFKDHRHSDTGTARDKYLSDRDYNPYEQGTYWGKFRTRNPFLRGRALRLIQGLLGEDLADMETRHFVIESFDGPNLDGTFTITAKDVLKLADADRAQAPLLSPGFLSAGIASGATSATLSPAGIGNSDYPASGYLNIGGKEIVAYTRVADALTLTRAQYDTTAVAHDSGDRCQLCLEYDAESPADVISDLFQTYAGIPASAIPLTDWQDEIDAFYRRNVSALIAEPTSVKKLVSELVEQVGLAIWTDDVENEIRLQVLRAISTTAETFDATNDGSGGGPNGSNVVEGSLVPREQPETRITQVWTYFGLKTPLEPLDEPQSYRETAILVDLDAEEDLGQPAFKIIKSRWIPSGGLTTAERINAIQLGRYVTPPRAFKFSLFRRGNETPALGEGCRLLGLPMQDSTGGYESVPIQITRLNPGAGLYDVEAVEMRFDDSYDEDPGDATVTFTASELNVNLLDRFEDLFPAAVAKDTVEFFVNSGVIIGSSSTSVAAMIVGNWPTQAVTGNRTSGSPILTGLTVDTATWAAVGQRVFGTGIPAGAKILTVDSATQITLDANATSGAATATALTVHTVIINLYVRGRIQGKGGNGGKGADTFDAGDDGEPGLPGGLALYTRYGINIFLDVGDADIWGGGGGGGGASVGYFNLGNGGGGGAGSNPGSGGPIGGTSSDPAEAGSPGTTEAGGAGGNGGFSEIAGGAGGGPGQAGAAGESYDAGRQGGASGAAGGAIDGVSYVDKTGVGDIRGSETN